MPSVRWTTWLSGLAVAAGTAAVLLATEPRLAIVWDEGYTLGRLERLRLWGRALRDPQGFAATWVPPAEELVQRLGASPPTSDQIDRFGKLFEPRVLAWFWPFAREEPHGHPPFYALVGLAGDLIRPGAPPLERARLGPMLVFAATAGVLFSFLDRRWGRWAAALGTGAWVFQPRLFAHAHYATYDALLTSLWVGAIVAFTSAIEASDRPRWPRWGPVAVFGLLAGCACDTKLTGWLLPLPFLAWSVVYRDRRGLLTLLCGGIVAAVLVYALNPPWWREPITGVVRFFESNLNRASSIRIKTLFLGSVYETPNGSLPWYNTLVWTAFVTPIGFLSLAVAGVVRSARRRMTEPVGVLFVGHWVFLLLLRALPHTPGHDGERQFLPAFGVLALLAALGGVSIVDWSKRWGKIVVVAAIAEGAVSVALMMPVPLSYYSPLMGGLPGAARLGMEPTYYWDALSDETLAWLNDHTGPGQSVLFATNPTSWLYLEREGKLRVRSRPGPGAKPVWYVVQNRPGAFLEPERAAIGRLEPVFVRAKWGVPLIWVFRYDDVERLIRRAE